MSQLASRYATALFEVTQKNGITAETLDSLLALSSALESNPRVREALKAPLLTDKDKEEILNNALGGSPSREVETFIKLLAKNNRLNEIPLMAAAFENKVSTNKGIMKGTVSSATELSPDEKSRVQKMIENKLKTTVELSYQTKPEMIGGIEAKVGSYIFEDSVKSHMSKLNDFITRRVQ